MAQRSTSSKLKAIQEVQSATETAMRSAVHYLRTSATPTSKGARDAIHRALRALQCECPEGIIVAGGKQSADPHATGRGRLAPGDPIVVDIFPRSRETGYFADMSRTFCIGAPRPKLKKMYAAVLGAQRLAFSMIRPGACGEDIQTAVDQYFEQKGFHRKNPRKKGGKGWLAEEGFIHGVGHGVGKKIHEPPKISYGKDILREGDIVTVEPGLYYKDVGGVRLEDMVLVTKRGCANLTRFSKKLIL
jgi:Xaa-Pro aminopeptidase